LSYVMSATDVRNLPSQRIMSYAEEDTVVSYEEEDMCVIRGGGHVCHVRRRTCVSYEEEDMCVI
jgi:hypothetical protein